MPVAAKVTLEHFREAYAECKPYFELLNGEPVQKALPTKLHATLQGILYTLLRELGFQSMTELTLAISDTWEPTPDVCGLLGTDDDEPYPTKPIPVVIEILSPRDPFTRVIQKCRKYTEWGIPDILVFDPVGREAWHWDTSADDLVHVRQSYLFQSKPVVLSLAEVFRRLDAESRSFPS
jgi:Uma2 family endonuclease